MAKLSGVFVCAALLVMARLLINVFGGKLMKLFSRQKATL
jgi:hypothetical protein